MAALHAPDAGALALDVADVVEQFGQLPLRRMVERAMFSTVRPGSSPPGESISMCRCEDEDADHRVRDRQVAMDHGVGDGLAHGDGRVGVPRPRG